MSARSFVIGLLVGVALCLGPIYCRDQAQTTEIRDLSMRLDSAQMVRHVAIESVTVFVPVVAAAKAESDRLSELVHRVGPTTLEVRFTPTGPPSLINVPRPVAQLIEAQGRTIAEQVSLIDRQAAVIAADSLVIARQDTLILRLKAHRSWCERRCGIAIGAVATLLAGAALR